MRRRNDIDRLNWLLALALAGLGIVTSVAGVGSNQPDRITSPDQHVISAESNQNASRGIGKRKAESQQPRHRSRDAYENRPLSVDSQAFRESRNVLPPRFRQYETRRYVVLSDADNNWTRTQAQRLERAHHQFHRYARRLDISPRPLKHKLVCILFAQRDDYKAFAQMQDDVSDPWISGYYAPRHDRIVFYNVETNPSVSKANQHLDKLEQKILKLNRQLDRAEATGEINGTLRQTLLANQQQFDKQLNRVEQFKQQVSVATTVHEAVHQLLFHTDVQSPNVEYPLWICEGLATAFETESPEAAFGPDHEYHPRRKIFREILRNDDLIKLPELVRFSRVPDRGDQSVRVLYHQSYALVTWMSRFRRDQLRTYLHLMRKQDGRPTANEHRKLFEQAFGEVEQLERDWLRYERDQVR